MNKICTIAHPMLSTAIMWNEIRVLPKHQSLDTLVTLYLVSTISLKWDTTSKIQTSLLTKILAIENAIND